MRDWSSLLFMVYQSRKRYLGTTAFLIPSSDISSINIPKFCTSQSPRGVKIACSGHFHSLKSFTGLLKSTWIYTSRKTESEMPNCDVKCEIFSWNGKLFCFRARKDNNFSFGRVAVGSTRHSGHKSRFLESWRVQNRTLRWPLFTDSVLLYNFLLNEIS